MNFGFVRKNRWDLAVVVVIFVLAVVPFCRTGMSGIINKTDAEFRLCPIMDFFEFSYLWVSRYSLGIDSFYGWLPPQLPLYSILAFLRFVSVPLWFVSRMMLVLIMFFLGTGMYFMVRQISRYRVTALVSCVLYMYNPLVERALGSMHVSILISYATFAWLLYFLYKGLYSETGNSRYAVWFSFITLFLVVDPVALGTFVILMFLFLLVDFVFVQKSDGLGSRLRFVVVTGLLCLCVHAWWLLPYFLKSDSLVYPYVLEFAFDHLKVASNIVPFKDFLGGGGDVFGTIVLVVVLIFAGVSFLSLLRSRKVLFWICLGGVGLFLIKGVCPPFGGIYKWMFFHFPGFGIYRSPGHFRILAVLAFAVLFGVGLDMFFGFVRSKGKFFRFTGVCIVMAAGAGVLGVNGKLISGNLEGTLSPVEVPDYYYEYSDKLESCPPDIRVGIPNAFWYIKYGWSPQYDMPIVHKFISPRPIVDQWTSSFNRNSLDMVNEVYKGFECIKTECVLKLFGMAGIKYVVGHNDVEVNRFNRDADPRLKEKQLVHLNQFGSKDSVGLIDLYEVDDKYVFPRLYASDFLVYVDGGLDLLRCVSYSDVLNDESVFVFEDDAAESSLEIKEASVVVLDSLDKHLSENISEMYFDEEEFYKKGFYAARDGQYKIHVKLDSNFVDVIESTGWRAVFGDSLEFRLWEYSGYNVVSECSVAENGMLVFSVEFDGDENEDEYAGFRREGLDVDLQQYPFLNMKFKLDDPDVQLVQIVLGIDFDDDGEVDVSAENLYAQSRGAFFDEYKGDILSMLESKFPDEERYILREVDVLPHKRWWFDCSGEYRGKYDFCLQEISFYASGEGIRSIDYVCAAHLNCDENLDAPVDLEEVSVMEVVGKNKKEGFVFKKFLLKLDLDDDGYADEEYILYEHGGPFVRYHKGMRYLVDLGGMIKNAFPEAVSYNLVDFNVMSGYDDLLECVRFGSQNKTAVEDFRFDRPVLEVDGDVFSFVGDGVSRDGVIFTEEIILDEGWHVVTNPLSGRYDSLSWDWIIVEPAGFERSEIKINYEKINPTRYLASVSKSGPFWLVFNESFDDDWKAFLCKSTKSNQPSGIIEKSALLSAWKERKNRIEIEDHFMVNGYANGWRAGSDFIQEAGFEGDVWVVVEYMPQRWFELGLLISLLSLFAAGIVLVKNKRI